MPLFKNEAQRCNSYAYISSVCIYNFSRCIYTVNSTKDLGLSGEGAIILEEKVAASMARFKVHQRLLLVTRNYLENVPLTSYIDNHSYF